MTTGWSDEARARAVLARHIRSRFGEQAYLQFKRTGATPAGLGSKRAPSKPPTSTPKPTPSLANSAPSVGKLQKAMDSFIITGSTVGRSPLTSLRAVDKVHSFPPAGKLIVKGSRASERKSGTYRTQAVRRGAPYLPKDILVNSTAAEPHLTFLHELGHYLDDALIDPNNKGHINKWASDLSPSLQTWREAMRASEHVSSLRKIAGVTGKRTIHVNGQDITIQNDYRHVRYLLQQKELFANSYAQWIALKSEDKTLTAEMDRRLSSMKYPKHMQWSDFHDVGAALDLLFEELQWLKS